MRALSLIMYIVQLRIYNGASQQLAVVTQNFFSCRPLCEINREAFTCYFSKRVQVQLRSIHACFHQFNQANTCRCWFNTWMHTVAFAVSQHTSLHSCVCVRVYHIISTLCIIYVRIIVPYTFYILQHPKINSIGAHLELISVVGASIRAVRSDCGNFLKMGVVV